jgi:DNA repair exonuclease SbcCD ATPase subunit
VHEKLLKNYFKDEKKEILNKILEYNKNYFNQLSNLETSKVNRWEITDFKWSNLFNYGTNNSINFQNLNGVVGIFGKNRSGKSSVVDSMLFTIFNKISKNVKSNQEYVNSSKKEASGEITLKIDNNIYNIVRKIEKNKSTKSSTSLQLKINNVINNDSSRIETDKYIQKLFGTLENFLLTSISSQFGSNNFIDEGSTKRKEILANFLELEIFDSLYELAKDDFSYIKSTIKKLETKNFNSLLKENKDNIDQYNLEKEKIEKELLEVSKILEDKKEKYITLSNIVKNITEYEDGYFDAYYDGLLRLFAFMHLSGNYKIIFPK